MKTIALAMVVLLTGCGTTREIHVPVKVAVPVKCEVDVPQRPVMPTEVLQTDARPFDRARAALAEIDFREGYEVELLAALKSCL